MSRTLLLAVLIAVVPCSAAGAFLDELNIINIENRSGSNIRYLFVTPGDSRYGGSNILGTSGPLQSGGMVSHFIHYPNSCDPFDILAVSEDGKHYRVDDFEVCDGKAATVAITAGREVRNVISLEFITVTFENGTGAALSSIFFTPEDTSSWGIDQLSATKSIAPGAALNVKLLAPAKNSVFGVRAVGPDHRTFSFSIEVPANETSLVFDVLADDADDLRDH